MSSLLEDDVVHMEVSEFFLLESAQSEGGRGAEEQYFLHRDKSLALIELYKKYKPKVGSFEVKSMKKLWEVIARELSNRFKITVSASKCENRWKTLERNYKKVVDHNNKTGSNRKVFEYEEQFNEIYGKKKNITPSLLLSNNSTIISGNRTSSLQNTVTPMTRTENLVRDPALYEKEVMLSIPDIENVNSFSNEQGTRNNEEHKDIPRPRKRSIRKVTNSYQKRNEILQEMKNDLKEYYTQKSQRDKEKLELERKKIEDRVKRTNLLEAFLTGYTEGNE